MDKTHLEATLPALDPSSLTGILYLGVDEVARAKGHDYMTVVYDMDTGVLLWVEKGRTADVFGQFLKALPQPTADGIKAVAMDMGPAYQSAVRQHLPNAAIVFDRFHIMQNFSKAIVNQRRIEFRRATKGEKELMKGSHFLLQKNRGNLSEKQTLKLDGLLSKNANLNTVYLLKEQLQAFWDHPESVEVMHARLEHWCELADESGLLYMKRFAKSLRRHAEGICNYARYPLTSARIEAGNVAIGMIRKRARGIRDTEYFKLKIRQTSIPDDGNAFYGTSCTLK